MNTRLNICMYKFEIFIGEKYIKDRAFLNIDSVAIGINTA